MDIFRSDYLFFIVGIYFLFTALMVFLELTIISIELISASFGILGLFFVLLGFNVKPAKAKKR